MLDTLVIEYLLPSIDGTIPRWPEQSNRIAADGSFCGETHSITG